MTTQTYKEVEATVEVPAAAGVEGFLLAIRKILKLGRVQRLRVEVDGKVHYTRIVRNDEPDTRMDVDFDTVLPSALVRNAQVVEVPSSGQTAAAGLLHLFAEAAIDGVTPIAFISGAGTSFYSWYLQTMGGRAYPRGPNALLCGLPFVLDRHIPDDTLLLATAYRREAPLLEMKTVYKLAMPTTPTPELVMA